MRSAIVTLLVAAAVGAAVFGASWTVQAAVLPSPERSDLIAANAASWLTRYRLVESAFSINGGPAIRGVCLQGWFPTSLRRSELGTVLHFGRHAAIVALAGHALAMIGVPRPERARTQLALLELGGCPRVLAHDLTALLRSAPRVHIERATIAGRPAIGIGVPVPHGRMLVYVAPTTYRPIAVSLSAGDLTGRSRIRLTRLTPKLVRPFLLRP